MDSFSSPFGHDDDNDDNDHVVVMTEDQSEDNNNTTDNLLSSGLIAGTNHQPRSRGRGGVRGRGRGHQYSYNNNHYAQQQNQAPIFGYNGSTTTGGYDPNQMMMMINNNSSAAVPIDPSANALLAPPCDRRTVCPTTIFTLLGSSWSNMILQERNPLEIFRLWNGNNHKNNSSTNKKNNNNKNLPSSCFVRAWPDTNLQQIVQFASRDLGGADILFKALYRDDEKRGVKNYVTQQQQQQQKTEGEADKVAADSTNTDSASQQKQETTPISDEALDEKFRSLQGLRVMVDMIEVYDGQTVLEDTEKKDDDDDDAEGGKKTKKIGDDASSLINVYPLLMKRIGQVEIVLMPDSFNNNNQKQNNTTNNNNNKAPNYDNRRRPRDNTAAVSSRIKMGQFYNKYSLSDCGMDVSGANTSAAYSTSTITLAPPVSSKFLLFSLAPPEEEKKEKKKKAPIFGVPIIGDENSDTENNSNTNGEQKKQPLLKTALLPLPVVVDDEAKKDDVETNTMEVKDEVVKVEVKEEASLDE